MRLRMLARIPVRTSVVVVFFLSFAFVRAEIMYKQVLSMGYLDSTGGNPQARLLAGADGTLYGTTYMGGNAGRGTFFAINPDGSGFRLLHSFRVTGDDGARPYAELVFGRDGAIYGTTEQGGINNAGTIFKIQPDGSGYQVLFRFSGTTGNRPRGHLTLGPDSYFYGTTQFGGVSDSGTVYKIRPDGSDFEILHTFGTVPNDGRDCDTGVTVSSDGMLYGVTSIGGRFTCGTAFKLATDGTGYEIMHHFDCTNGLEPDGYLLELTDGTLYGTTQLGSAGSPTLIYKMNKDGSGFEVVRFFDGSNGEPSIFLSGLVLGDDGALYGSLLSGIIKIQPDGSGFEVLHRWPIPSVDDGYAGHGLTIGAGGVLYGVTAFGGTNRQGVVFKINPDGSDYSILHHFKNHTNGLAIPRATLLRGQSGLYFGTTESGGVSNAGAFFSVRADGRDARLLFSFAEGTNTAKMPNGLCDGLDGFLYGTTVQGGWSNAGTIFRIRPDGSDFGVLKNLGATGEPRSPRGRLMLGIDGWLYGTSTPGGSAGRGTIYKVNRDGELVVLRSLNTADGYQPQCDLVQDGGGSLYGTAFLGGAQSMGVVFRIQPDGSEYTTLHSFTGGAQGQNPMSGVILASDGRLYGTTSRQFGAFAGCVYRLNTDGTGFQALKAFPSAGSDPKLPRHALVEGRNGVLYGSTQLGGLANKGTIFSIRMDGSACSILHEFGVAPGDAETPAAAFTAVGDGSFLGVADDGGDSATGAVFRFDPTEVRLSIARNGENVELRWPGSSTTDTLEATAGLDNFQWQGSSVAIGRQGDEHYATVPRSSAGQVFRVRRTWE